MSWMFAPTLDKLWKPFLNKKIHINKTKEDKNHRYAKKYLKSYLIKNSKY